MCIYQVSPPCVLQLASLRCEEVVLKKIACGLFKQYVVVVETCNRHGNDIGSSLCVLPLESLRSEEVNLKKSACGSLLLFTNMYCCDFDVGY